MRVFDEDRADERVACVRRRGGEWWRGVGVLLAALRVVVWLWWLSRWAVVVLVARTQKYKLQQYSIMARRSFTVWVERVMMLHSRFREI